MNSSNNKEKLLTSNNLAVGSTQSQMKYQDNVDYSDKGKNCHSKNTEEDDGLDIEYLNPDLKVKIKKEIEKSDRQQMLLKENKKKIIDFLIDNKDSIRIEDLKIYEPIYKCMER